VPIPIELLKPFEAAFGKDMSAFLGGGQTSGAQTPPPAQPADPDFPS
jgi:hypothetical protein